MTDPADKHPTVTPEKQHERTGGQEMPRAVEIAVVRQLAILPRKGGEE